VASVPLDDKHEWTRIIRFPENLRNPRNLRLCKELAFGTAAPLARHFRLLRGKDLPVALGLFGRHDLAIIAEDHVRADVAHVQGQPR
jgi:hypothetical protein